MTRLLSRTSITVDEAVYILLGRSTGPIEFEPTGESEDAEANAPAFCPFETLDDELDVLVGEYEQAKYEKRPADVIAEKHAALQRQKAARDEADKHLCAINDELNKGEQSTLKLDRALSNAVYRFITLHSFNEWVKLSAGSSTESAPLSVKGKKKPRRRMREQENAILEEIRKQGLDPQALPPYLPGKRGVKSDIRDSLKYSPLFTAKTAFKNAWEDLADYHLTRYAKDPTPHKKMK